MMTIGEVLDILATAKPEVAVYFRPFNCVPGEVISWRGRYNEPALEWEPTGYSGDGGTVCVRALMNRLKEAIDGRTFTGWKGGEFRFTRDSPLHVDNAGDYTNTEIDRILVFDFAVFIHTMCDE